jgi:hypothetical protein
MRIQKLSSIGIGALTGTMIWTSEAHATCDGNACAQEKIERLYVQGDGDVAISTTGDEKKLDCAPRDDIYIVLRRSHVAFSEIYSALLGAKLSNHDVWLRVIGGSGECAVSYLVLE